MGICGSKSVDQVISPVKEGPTIIPIEYMSRSGHMVTGFMSGYDTMTRHTTKLSGSGMSQCSDSDECVL